MKPFAVRRCIAALAAGATLTLTLSSCATMTAPEARPAAPVAPTQHHVVGSPHGDRIDEYYWLRDDDPQAKRPQIMDYLRAENAYTEAMLAHTQPLQERLVRELRARIKEDDASVPVYDNGYWYSTRFEVGAEYPVHLRQRGGVDGPDAAAPLEVTLDLPALAKGKPFFSLGGFAVSPDNRWPCSTSGRTRRRCSRVRCIAMCAAAIPPPTSWCTTNRTRRCLPAWGIRRRASSSPSG